MAEAAYATSLTAVVKGGGQGQRPTKFTGEGAARRRNGVADMIALN